MSRLRGVKVLLVDDNQDSREVLCLFLESQGAVVRCLDDSEAVLEAIDSFKPRVLVSDLNMPNVNGFELLRQIRARPGGKGLPAIAFSGLGSAADRERARDAGFEEHLVKPIDPDRLVQAILAVIG